MLQCKRIGDIYVYLQYFISGEWWDANVVDVENEALATGGAPNISNAYTINGKPGRLYPCSRSSKRSTSSVQFFNLLVFYFAN